MTKLKLKIVNQKEKNLRVLKKKMNPQTEKLVRRTTMIATVTASYFLLTADYGPQPNVLDPIKKAIESAQESAKQSFKAFVFGAEKDPPPNHPKVDTDSTK